MVRPVRIRRGMMFIGFTYENYYRAFPIRRLPRPEDALIDVRKIRSLGERLQIFLVL